MTLHKVDLGRDDLKALMRGEPVSRDVSARDEVRMTLDESGEDWLLELAGVR